MQEQWTLEALLADCPGAVIHRGGAVPVQGVAYDSRDVREGYCFVCIQGFKDDGHRYIGDALRRGAVASVVEKAASVPDALALAEVPDARDALALISSRFYRRPSERLTLIGITGTEGKTTTAYLVEAVLREAGIRVAMSGTIVSRIGEKETPSHYTTPESLDLQRFLADCVAEGATHVVMEVSSHALALKRVATCAFNMGVFTNLSSDHLDLHGHVERYVAVKASLFSSLGASPEHRAIVNADDPAGERILAVTACPATTFAIHRQADLRARDLIAGLRQLRLTIESPRGSVPLTLSLTGWYNAYNALAATGVGLALGIDLEAIKLGLEQISGIPGRFELVEAGQAFLVVIDFAHTTAALEKLLRTTRSLVSGRLLTVFGCPGDRDRTKRAAMGEVAARLSEYTVLTTDNPASEDPADIARQIQEGVRRVDPSGNYHAIILDRAEAIAAACARARPGDAVLI
ncbi:MAG: UDP-N-acetylmuramoyl-L-alanyl-D-glutamate--2,6-diaminopimelate ligase, partial [Candidatus Methylomirabilales bacterium]